MFEFLDIESSGIDEQSYPIEVGFTLGNEVYSYLIKRPPEWSFWDELSEECYHNISREELAAKGLEPIAVVTIMNQLLKGMILYTDAYPFDDFWLRKLYTYVGIEMSFKLVDFKKLTADYGISDYSFFELKEELNDESLSHRAAYDAKHNKEVMKKLIKF